MGFSQDSKIWSAMDCPIIITEEPLPTSATLKLRPWERTVPLVLRCSSSTPFTSTLGFVFLFPRVSVAVLLPTTDTVTS